MLRSTLIGAVVAVAVVAATLAGCGGDDSDRAEDLAERVGAVLRDDEAEVRERLGELGLPGDADVGAIRCPAVREPAAGDRATCTAEVGGTEVSVEIEFRGGDAIGVIGVAVEE